MSAPRLQVVEILCRERPYRLRMPFRFGVTTSTHGLQAGVSARIRLADGREATGYAAEALAAKWFDKNLALSDEDNVNQLRKSLELAADRYLGSPPATAFDLFADSYRQHQTTCATLDLNPLIAGFGPALIDRAVLDALCRSSEVSFYTAVRANLAGIRGHPVAPDLHGFDFERFLASLQPSTKIHARHTVGLIDPLTRADQSELVDDGLPETLVEVIEIYGNHYFKLKVGGDQAADIDRLQRIAAVLDRTDRPYLVTLDGNEQYEDAEAVLSLVRQIRGLPNLARLSASILYLEQPIKRSHVFSEPVDALAALVPVIIDESDGELSSFPRARSLGYTGISSKTCKGIYKSILNAARCRLWNEGGERRHFMSAEDLTCEPGIALQQDLALVNLLGLRHVERNSHHFIDGFGGRPEAEARAFLAGHGDLYHEHGGRVRLRIESGVLSIASLDCRGFAAAATPDVAATDPMPAAAWQVHASAS